MSEGGYVCVIKQRGRRPSEPLSRDKLYQSVKRACLQVRAPEGVAEQVAEQACRDVEHWCQSRPEITSDDIRRVAGRTLKQHHPEAAYLYQQQRLMI